MFCSKRALSVRKVTVFRTSAFSFSACISKSMKKDLNQKNSLEFFVGMKCLFSCVKSLIPCIEFKINFLSFFFWKSTNGFFLAKQKKNMKKIILTLVESTCGIIISTSRAFGSGQQTGDHEEMTYFSHFYRNVLFYYHFKLFLKLYSILTETVGEFQNSQARRFPNTVIICLQRITRML